MRWNQVFASRPEDYMQPKNLLFILSDEHQRAITGCYGNPLVRTPNLDGLAAGGVRFLNAYTPCPICVPARSALATGRWVHQTRSWDNAHPYCGSIPSWHHRLRQAGHRVASIGKLHFRDAEDDNGFTEEILPLHVLNGIGDLLGLIRNPPAMRGNMPALALEAGCGQSSYNDYDREIAEAACSWLAARGREPSDKPWVLFVSFVRPHFPLVAPEEFYALYPPQDMPWPRLYDERERPTHPVVRALYDCMNYDEFFDAESVRRAIAAYYALVTFLDDNIGRVLRALDGSGLGASTRVIYTSDHGDNLGNRGLWGKSVMYEESAAVPFIVSGPDIAAGGLVDQPISLIDLYGSILDAVGAADAPEDQGLPTRSFWPLIGGAKVDRTILSEYHAAASVTGIFMIRHGRWKYTYYVGERPELFDLHADPGETTDLAADPTCAPVLAELEARLRAICDPEAVSAQAFADQREKIVRFGGVEAVKARGDFGYTPAPGEKPGFA
jgi:choline-sulfatase